MDIIKKFGDMVGEESIRNPEKARKLLLTGYRLQEKRLQLFPDRKLPASGQYVARVVMQNIIKALAKPDGLLYNRGRGQCIVCMNLFLSKKGKGICQEEKK